MKKRGYFWNWPVIGISVLLGVVLGLGINWAIHLGDAPETPETPDPVVVVVQDSGNWDVSALDGWCGQPSGRIRMVGAWYSEPGVFEDETGNLWGWDGDIDENAFYLLWIDNGGDSFVQNDEIVKVWREN